MKKSFFEKKQAKSIVFEKIQGEISHFFKKSTEKHVFLPRKCIEKRVTRKFGESFTETFGGHPKVSAKLSVKLSLAIRKFHETFGGQMKVSWNFRWPDESFMKLSYGERKFHRKFHWNFRMATESFSETFAKLSSNFRMTLFSMHFLGKQIMFFSFFLGKKMRNFTLEFFKKQVFAWIFFKKWLFPWFVQTMFSFLLKLSPRS